MKKRFRKAKSDLLYAGLSKEEYELVKPIKVDVLLNELRRHQKD